MNRLYILPVYSVVDLDVEYRGPKYLEWRFGAAEPGLESVRWLMADYGDHPTMITHCILDTSQHNILNSKSDVAAIPEDIDSNLTQGEVNKTKTYLESMRIPAGWIDTSFNFRTILRILLGLFAYVGRLGARSKIKHFLDVYPLSTAFRDLPVTVRDRMAETADSFGIDYSSIGPDNTVREFFVLAGKHWRNRERNLGGYII